MLVLTADTLTTYLVQPFGVVLPNGAGVLKNGRTVTAAPLQPVLGSTTGVRSRASTAPTSGFGCAGYLRGPGSTLPTQADFLHRSAVDVLGGALPGSGSPPWTTAMLEVGRALLDLVVPRICAGCDRPGHLLCPAVRSAAPGEPVRTQPRPCPAGFPPAWATSSYDGPLREAILAHKEHGRLALARPLGEALARSVQAAAGDDLERASSSFPVPSRGSATRQRGHDPVLRMARVAAGRLRSDGRTASVLTLLRASRGLADQAGLSGPARAANLHGAHRIRRGVRFPSPETRIILVDDVVTTGASLAEAARALCERLGSRFTARQSSRRPSGETSRDYWCECSLVPRQGRCALARSRHLG